MKNTATIQTHDQKFDYKKNFENERYSDVHSYTILTLYVFQVSNIYPLNVSEQPVATLVFFVLFGSSLAFHQ